MLHLVHIAGAAGFISCVIFGYMSQDREWMPRPDQNSLSWAFAFFVLSCFSSIVAAFSLSQSGVKEVHDYRKKVDLNLQMMGSYPPPQNYPGALYPGTGAYPTSGGGAYPTSGGGYPQSFEMQPGIPPKM